MPPELVPSAESVDNVACDVLLVGAHSSGNDFDLGEAARRADELLGGFFAPDLRRVGFAGRIGDFALFPTHGKLPAAAVAVAGLGPRGDARSLRRAAGAAARRVVDQSVVAVAIDAEDEAGYEAVAEGLLLGSYRFGAHKSKQRVPKLHKLLVLNGSPTALGRAAVHAEATTLARDLVNEPAAGLTPDLLARRAEEIADVSELQCIIWKEDELEARGFGGIIGVGKGSANPPRLIQLRYRPEGSSDDDAVALVGKGVTFDSGGLSLKDPRNMEAMKTDMAGGAAVLACMSALARLDVRCAVNAYIPTVENMPSGTAARPGDVFVHYGGQTTEVTNTDAEGRLIMADVLVLAGEHGARAIVDVATLTGTIIVALGHRTAGLFSNDDDLAGALQDAARRAGEKVWRMPLDDEYRSDLDSHVADIRNSGPRFGGPILAALFLKGFVAKGIPWAHLDIAGTGRSDKDADEISRGGTGFATRTLIRWLEARGQ